MINKTLITPRKNQVRQQNIKYENQNTKYANQKFTLFCREAIFVANLRTFLAYFLEAKKYGGVPKRTNIRNEYSLSMVLPSIWSLLTTVSFLSYGSEFLVHGNVTHRTLPKVTFADLQKKDNNQYLLQSAGEGNGTASR